MQYFYINKKSFLIVQIEIYLTLLNNLLFKNLFQINYSKFYNNIRCIIITQYFI